MVVFSAETAAAQYLSVKESRFTVSRNYTTENGLPGNSTTAVIQDSRGYIWLSGFNGLVRYDGYRFLRYTMENVEGLTSNRFVYVTEGIDGSIMAGLEHGGLLVISDGQTEVYELDKELYGVNLSINAIHQDPTGTIWLGTESHLFQLDQGLFKEIDTGLDLPGSFSTQIISDDQYVYLLFARSLIRYDIESDTFTPLLKLSDENDQILYRGRTIEDSTSLYDFFWRILLYDDIILLAHENGIAELSETGIRHLLHRNDIEISRIHGIFKESHSFYVYGLDGLFRIDNLLNDPHEAVRYTPFNTAHASSDNEGGIWMATNANGLIYSKPTPVYQGSSYDILTGTPVTALFGLDDQTLYTGTNCDGLYQFSGDSHTRYSYEEGILNNCVWSVTKQSDGTLWAGTWGAGLFFKAAGNEQFQRFNPDVMRDATAILSLFEDSGGRLWIGSYYNGLFMYDGETTVPILNNNSSVLSAVRTIYETSQGELYFATDRGIGILRSDMRVEKPEHLSILRTTNFRTITSDPEGRLWFGSYGDGLVVMDGERIKPLSTEQGLHDNSVSQLRFDPSGNLWLAGNRGVSYVEKDQVDLFLNDEIDFMRVSRIATSEGLRVGETTGGFMPSSHISENGHLYIPLVNGLARIETSDMRINQIPPRIYLEEIEINGVGYSPASIQSISFDDQRIIFRFSVISYQNPDYVTAEYKLEGLDLNWQTASESREAIYTTLPHGVYTLRVRASNNDGIWNEEGLSYTFTVSPPFWITWWFMLSVILFLSLLLFLLYRYRMARIQKTNAELEREVEIRTEELNQLNQELQQLIMEKNKMQRVLGHDLRNPLSGIIGYLELLSMPDGTQGNTDQKEIIEMLIDASKDTLSLLENLLSFSGSESSLNPNFRKIAVKSLIRDTLNITEIQASQKNITVNQTGSTTASPEIDQNMMLSVLRNLISNAIKFSPNGSVITIDVQETDSDVMISVIDQGVGMSPEKVETLFNEELKSSQLGTMGEKGMGIGLQICRDFTEKHNGTLSVESSPGEGSTFTVVLPKVQKNGTKGN
ncbi:MAG: GHKL domain-containing protein [Balneolaceae bacterium]|nr:MAG: GHKL domain-containing protein [Balneolaceae bacterium]